MVRDTSISARSLGFAIHLVLLFILIVTAYPILHVISMSVSEPDAIVARTVTFFPKGFQTLGYSTILDAGRVPRAFKNSVIYTCVGTTINLFVTILMAYPLSKKRLTFRGFYTILAIITMYFGGGLIPTFLLVRKLGMYDTMWALVVPTAMSVYNMILMRTFFMSIPESLEESAYLDGGNDFQVLRSIVLPLSKAMIATIGLFYAVGHWNMYFHAVIYLKSAAKYPLQVILHQIVTQNEVAFELAQMQTNIMEAMMQVEDVQVNEAKSEMIKYSTLVASLVPMMVVYPFVQRYFVKGLMIGSFKGE